MIFGSENQIQTSMIRHDSNEKSNESIEDMFQDALGEIQK